MNRLQTFKFPSNTRLIAISDIHGRYDLLDELLNKVKFNNNDILVLMGDYSQKGKYPLKTLRYIMNLSKQNNVYCLLGNCDHGNYKIFDPKYLNNDFKILLDIKTSLLYDMKKEYFFTNKQDINLSLSDLQMKLLHEYNDEITFLKGLPLMLETDDFLFVHAGLDKIRNYYNSWYRSIFMKRYFYYQGHLADKNVICGHMPVTIYRNEFNDNILIDLKRKIVSIDGGMTVKAGGQLNALIIYKKNNKYIYTQDNVDGLPTKVLSEDSIGEKRGRGPCWPYFNLEIIEEGEYFSKIRLLDNNEITYIKNEYVNKLRTSSIDDCPAEILNIKKGSKVGIVDNTCEGYVLVKYQGKQGWIRKEIIKE